MKENIYKRILDRLTLTDDEWNEIYKDIQEGETKNWICAKYGLKAIEHKVLKKKILG